MEVLPVAGVLSGTVGFKLLNGGVDWLNKPVPNKPVVGLEEIDSLVGIERQTTKSYFWFMSWICSLTNTLNKIRLPFYFLCIC